MCSTKQQFDETTVTDYLDYPLRVYPVGRLDKESQGLLLLTNEGDLVNKIMRAGNYHEKEYFVTVNKPVDREFVRRMSKGVPVLDTVTRPCRVVQTGECSFRIILTQGLNRQIRRMCRYLGYEVQKLKRIRIMNLTLDGIREGEYREITAQEWEELNHLLESSTSETVIRTGEQNGNSSDHANERAGAKAGVRDMFSSVVKPERQLAAFRRLTLAPGESRRVELTVGPKQLRTLGSDYVWRVEPGKFELQLGDNAENILLRADLTVE